MASFMTGLLSGLVGGGTAMVKQADAELEDIRKARLTAFNLQAQSDMAAEERTSRETMSREDRTSRETMDQKRITSEEKRNAEQIAASKANTQAQIGAANSNAQRAYELALREFDQKSKGVWGAPVQLSDGSYAQMNSQTGAFRPAEMTVPKDTEQARMLREQGMTEGLPQGLISSNQPLKLKGDGTKNAITVLTEQLSVYKSLYTKANESGDTAQANDILGKMEMINTRLDNLLNEKPITENGSVDKSQIDPATGKPKAPTGNGVEHTATSTATQSSGLHADLTQMQTMAEQEKNARQQATQSQLKKEALTTFRNGFTSALANAVQNPSVSDRYRLLTRLYRDAEQIGDTQAIEAIRPELQKVVSDKANRSVLQSMRDW